jgi:hypothetical protein
MNAHFAGIGAFALAPARETYPGLQLVVANSFRDLCVTLVQAAGTQRSRGVCMYVCVCTYEYVCVRLYYCLYLCMYVCV